MTAQGPRRDGTCFFEADPSLSLAQRAGAEAIGTFLLVFTVMASGLAQSGTAAAAPAARGLAIGPALTALILVFGQVSGGHYNPLISLSQWMTGRRNGACLAAYVGAQVAGAVLAARLAVLAFGPVAAASAEPLDWTALLAAELFATAGLMTLVLGAPRMRPAGVGPFAVGGWVMMTVVGLPAAPAANPAITAAALAAGLAPSPAVAGAHLAAEAVGLALALLAAALIAQPGTERHAG
ncbi:aquaporin [Phenylobacterium sp.]|uniref:aquaporin n=1 Tax=Phenylobacterium sp. TaxID=1871053 RepID=UPI0025E5ADB6|nr:aquaporin [Phenylobacterium sp.]